MNKWDYKTKITPGSLVKFANDPYNPLYALVISVERTDPREVLGAGVYNRYYLCFLNGKGKIQKMYLQQSSKWLQPIKA